MASVSSTSVSLDIFSALIFRCPECDTYSDDPIKTFDLPGCAPAPESDFLLVEALCNTCETRFDLALMSVPEKLRTGDSADVSQGLLERYHSAVNAVVLRKGPETRSEDGRAREFKGSLEAGLEFLNLDENPDFERRLPIISMEVLALARGLRIAADRFLDRIFVCLIGRLCFVMSVDQSEEASPPIFAMHLSISRIAGGAPLTNVETGFALTLFFSTEELSRHKGNIYEHPSFGLAGKEVKHYYIPWPMR